MKNIILSEKGKKVLIILLIFSVIYTSFELYSIKKFIYTDYIISFSDTLLSLNEELVENKDMTSNEFKDILCKYKNIESENRFYFHYQRIDHKFKRLYQKEFLYLVQSQNNEYTEKQIDATRKLVSQITKETMQNKHVVNIREGQQTVKINTDVYLLFQNINSTIYETKKKINCEGKFQVEIE
ncbi:hypothetical protein [Aminipila luticellarii]|uniref:Uncharacterized protein n=1 Tax=Aminipila luticellarii TaxID=2507160 RepID=A0A410PXR8_9FIRM|nr:hypothetical protein [Aminipila luticellarii]QAT43640.1 hypothetical protein EQM06_10640 [Aminipila luticellarii]